MTTSREKIRALFLTALMVLSVVAMTTAFAGSAAADPNAVNVTDGPVEYTDGAGNNEIQLLTNKSYGTMTGGTYTFMVVDRTGDRHPITVGGGNFSNPAGDVVQIDLDNAGIGDLTGDATLWVNSTVNQDFDVRTTSTTVTEDNLNDKAAYQGEWVAVMANNTNNAYEVFTDGDFQFRGNTGGIFVGAENTSRSDFQTGEDSEIVFDDSGASVNLTIRNLGLDVESDEDSYETTTGSVDIDFTVTSNVAGRTVDITLYYARNDSEADDFTGVNVGSNREFEGTFEDVNDGPSYYIEVEDIDTGITVQTDDIPVDEVEGAASFTSRAFTEERGDVANITINLDNTDEATVFLGSRDIGYLSEFTVEDGNDDGFVAVNVDTFREGTDAGNGDNDIEAYNPNGRSSDDQDEVTGYTLYTATLGANDPLASGSYDLNVSAADEENVATLQLNERTTESATTWIAARDASTGNVTQIQNNAFQRSKTANGDKIIIQVQASGLYAYMGTPLSAQRARPGGANPGVYMEIEQSDTVGNVQAKAINMSNVSYQIDEDNNQFFVVIDTGDKVTEVGDERIDDGEAYEATFIINETSPYVDDDSGAEVDEETVSTTFTVQEPSISVNGATEDFLNVSQGNVTIGGTTNLAPDSEISVRLESTTSGVPFLLTDPEIPVSEDGSWSTTLDMSDVPTGSTYDLTVRSAGGGVDPVELQGTVLGAPTASVTFDDQNSNGEVVVVQSATLSRGGFVAIHEGSASGPVIGSSRYLSPGTHENVRIALDEPISEDGTLVAMPHLDTNSNNVYEFPDADGPYTADGAAVTDDAAITIQAGGTVVVTRETPTPRVVTRTVPGESPTPREVTRTVVRTQTPGQPGFGIAIAVVALIAAALLAVRRRD